MDKYTKFNNFLESIKTNSNQKLIESIQKGFSLIEGIEDKGRITVKITFDNGDFLFSTINGDLESAKKYYLGNEFNLGSVEDNMTTAIKVEQITPSNLTESQYGINAPEFNADPIIPNALRVISSHPDAIKFTDKNELSDFYNNQSYFSASHSHCFYDENEMENSWKTGIQPNPNCEIVRDTGRKLVMVWDDKNSIGYVIPGH